MKSSIENFKNLTENLNHTDKKFQTIIPANILHFLFYRGTLLKFKAVRFALNALNEFNSKTNFSPRTTVFFKCGNRKKMDSKVHILWSVVQRGKGEKSVDT